MKSLKQEAFKYDLTALKNLQEKRKQNIQLFEYSVQKERDSIVYEETIQATLESKLRFHNLGIARLSDTEYQTILQDLPKIKSTYNNRKNTISLLKNAIRDEQAAMDREESMIEILEVYGSQKRFDI